MNRNPARAAPDMQTKGPDRGDSGSNTGGRHSGAGASTGVLNAGSGLGLQSFELAVEELPGLALSLFQK